MDMQQKAHLFGSTDSCSALDLPVRLRRNRKAAWVRDIVRENTLRTSDLIVPMFVIEGEGERHAVPSMPQIERVSVDEAVADAQRAASLGIPALILFPYIAPSLRDARGSEAINPENIICRAIRAIKQAVPEIGIISDVALDPYTSHGHDGIMLDTHIVNDPTTAILARQALLHAQAGADVIAPSDMMDGRVREIRTLLDVNGYQDVSIMSYAAKYASAFYGPFRDAIGTNAVLTGDKRTYQMDPANSDEALRECALDLEEGADMLIVKPGMPYLDVLWRVKDAFRMPTIAYQVSGEYAMIHAAAQNGWLDLERTAYESLIAFKRAGADAIITYFAYKIADKIKNG